jgi:RNA polymerase sigma-70 factor (sigma-E family)
VITQLEARMSDEARSPAPGTAVDFDGWAEAAGPSLLRFAHAVTGNSHDAADAAQDALIAVYARWVRLSRTGDPDSYARRVIVNRTISWWRKIGRRETAQLSETVGPVAADHAVASGDTAMAEALIRSLPARQRAAVVLRYFDDLGFAEIAAILGCPESTARSHVHRALARLREQFGEENHG